jgi:hypothetical protein
MRPLSSSAAIVPAFRRMRTLLFQPFDWGSFLRITLAAVLAESMVVSFRYVTPHLDFGDPPAIPESLRQAWGFWMLAGIAALVAVDLVLLGWYGIVRLRFTLFYALVHESQGLGEGWRSWARPADRLFRATLLITFGIVLLVVALMAVIAVGVFGVTTLRTPDGKLDAGVFLIFFFPTIGFLAAIVVACLLARVVLHDFILPHMALENRTFREAWHEVRRRVRADRESFFSYLLLRTLFAILAAPLLAILAFLILWPAFWVLGASAAGYNALMDEATGVWGAVQIALNVVLLLLGGALGVAGAAVFGGPLAVFLRAHAMYFYGSRYKALGDLLTEPVVATAEARDA